VESAKKKKTRRLLMAALMTLLRLLALVLITVGCVAVASGDDVVGLRSGVWDVSTLVPGKGSVPPIHELHVDAGRWRLHERNFSRVSLLFETVAARLGFVYTAVPIEETSLCHSTSLTRWAWTATRTDGGVVVDCLPTDWFTAAAMRRFAREGYLHLRFSSAQPLSVAHNGTCVATSWSVTDAVFAKVSEESVVVSATLQASSAGQGASCKAYFELSRRPTVAVAEKSSPSGVYGPIVLLLVVVAMRLLPRYILTRTGQIDRSSYRGRNPAKLTARQRAELLQKQRRIIAQMKAEDQANAAAEQTR
jgi:hypothetical protein